MDEFVAAKKLQQQKIDKCEEEALQCVPNWLIEVLAWLNRIEMANSSIPISCLLFHKLCQPKLHGNIPPYIVAKLHFDLETKRLKCRKSVDIPSCEMVENIPIAKCPPPPYIIGFKSISFGFIDADVMEFVKNILPLASSRWLRYQESILSPYLDRDVLAATDDVRQLLTMLTTSSNDNIGGQIEWLRWECEGLDLCRQFTLNFPGILDNVQILCITHPSWDRTFIDIAFKWLIKKVRRIDGKPKILFFGGALECKTVLLNRIKEEFHNSTQPITFFVLLQDWTCRFKMENNRTGEVLLLVTIDNSDEIDWWYLLRCPKGTENEWKEEGLKLFFNSAEMDKATIFNVEWERKIDDVPIKKKKKNIFSKCFKK